MLIYFRDGGGILSNLSSTTNQSNTVTDRILRDMSDGVMMVTTDGTISFINQIALLTLGLSREDVIGKKYVSIFIGLKENDDFNQLILDSIYDHENAHSGIAKYYNGNCTSSLEITTSFLYDDTTSTKIGVIAVFKDITELERLNQLKRESTILFSLLLLAVGVSTFVWQIIASKINNGSLPIWIMSRIIEVIAVVLFIIAITKTSMTMKDLGLYATKGQLSKSLKEGLFYSAVVVIIMVMVKWVISLTSLYFTVGHSFWDWGLVNLSSYTYFLVAPAQEFLAKGVMQGTLNRIMGKSNSTLIIILSSVIFSTLHAFYGAPMMVFAFLLTFALGLLYDKHKNIWGCSLIHWTVGIAGGFLGYFG